MATELIGKKLVPSATTVTDSATAIPATAATGRQSIDIYNNGAVTIFIGDSTVTSTNGRPVAPGDSFSADVAEGAVVYGITASGTSDIRSLEGV